MVRLFARAVHEGDWDLCKELARFLKALDNSGKTLREALELVQLRAPGAEEDGEEDKKTGSFMFEGALLGVPPAGRGRPLMSEREFESLGGQMGKKGR